MSKKLESKRRKPYQKPSINQIKLDGRKGVVGVEAGVYVCPPSYLSGCKVA